MLPGTCETGRIEDILYNKILHTRQTTIPGGTLVPQE